MQLMLEVEQVVEPALVVLLVAGTVLVVALLALVLLGHPEVQARREHPVNQALQDSREHRELRAHQETLEPEIADPTLPEDQEQAATQGKGMAKEEDRND